MTSSKLYPAPFPVKKSILIALLGLVAGGVAWYGYAVRLSSPDAALATEQLPTPSHAQVQLRSEPLIPVQPPFAAEKVALPPGSISSHFEELVKSRKPADAFRAANIVLACNRARLAAEQRPQLTDDRAKALWSVYGTPDEKCGDLKSGQIAQLVPLAIAAGIALVPGSFNLLAGLSYEDPTDQQLAEAIARVQKIHIAAGSPEAILADFNRHDNCSDPPACTGRDPFRALEMWTALQLVHPQKGPDQISARLIQELGAQRAEAAIASARNLVKEAGRK